MCFFGYEFYRATTNKSFGKGSVIRDVQSNFMSRGNSCFSHYQLLAKVGKSIRTYLCTADDPENKNIEYILPISYCIPLFWKHPETFGSMYC